MSKFKEEYTKDFRKDLKKIKSDFKLQKRLSNKINEILDNPYHYKPLRNILKNKRRTRISNFVLIFTIDEISKKIKFETFKDHDEVYKN